MPVKFKAIVMASTAILAAAAMISVFSSDALSVSNNVAFRPLINKNDLDGKKFDIVNNGDGEVYIWKLRYLADRDIEKVDIYRSASAPDRLLVGFTINQDGAKRLRHFTNRFGIRRLAIFADGRLLDMIPPVAPSFLGDRIVVRWPGSENELRRFALRINRKPPGMMALYIEEVGKYNDVAVEAWASAYTEANKFIEERIFEAQANKAVVEEASSQGE